VAARVDVLVPTCERPAALAVTMSCLQAQGVPLRVVVSDQSETLDAAAAGEVLAVIRVLRAQGHAVEVHKHLPRRGLAEQRQFLLDRATAALALFLDDDVILEPGLVARLVTAIEAERCGFVGSAVIGLGHARDVRPHEQHIDLWDGPVRPERVRRGEPAWNRHRLHNAANLWHVQRRLGIRPERQRRYKVAWAGGCVLYDVEKLRACGGFSFWPSLPTQHAGEDVLAQLRVMERYGGCCVIPSGAFHQELPTTVDDRRVDAPRVLA
jgi:GT2 family glycosyltransferase